eukprot:5667805-Heterocapsa_arctica.AAC.1
MARGIPDGPVPPKTLSIDFDVDVRFRCRFSPWSCRRRDIATSMDRMRSALYFSTSGNNNK